MLLALLSGCHLFVSGEIEKTCDDIPGCAAESPTDDTGVIDTAPPTDDTGCPDPAVYYADLDDDGFGDANNSVESCAAPDGYTSDSSDCDDGDAASYPGADEIWYDGVDQDCAGGQDYDQDGDGYVADVPGAPDGGGYDCEDTDADVHPDQAEVCDDGVDNNCDGSANGCGLSGGLSLDDAARVFTGDPDQEIGTVGGWIGDVNFSGTADFALGAPDVSTHSTSIGQVWIVTDDASSGALADEAFLISGGPEYEALGLSVAPAGDVDNDGAADFLVGAPYSPVAAYFGGRTYLFRGPVNGDLTVSDAAGSYIGVTDDAYSGYASLAQEGAGPSGEDILAISEFGWSGGAGRVLYIRAQDAMTQDSTDALAVAQLVGPTDNAVASGFALASGDFNGDGVPDLAVSGPGFYGGTSSALYVVFGPPASGETLLTDADVYIKDEVSYDALGYDIALGDIDGDGRDDLVASAPYYDDKYRDVGAVFVYNGAEVGASRARDDADALIVGDEETMYTGQNFAMGDVDGDGRSDLLLGASGAITGGRPTGAAFLFVGPVSGLISTRDATARVAGQDRTDKAGTLVDLAYANNDIYADMLIGVPGWDLDETSSGSDAGAAYVFPGQGL